MDPSRDFLCIGHRGARGHAPENTLLSIDTGIRLGAGMIEFDVQRCVDELVVIHDLRLERTTNGRGRVGQARYDDLRRLDAGAGQHIPSLREVLDLVEARVALNIELKSADGTASQVAQVLRGVIGDGWSAEQFLVSSFHLPELYEFKQILPEVPVAALVGVLLGAPTLRLRGDYLAIVTLGFGEIIRVFLNNLDAPVNVTNGPLDAPVVGLAGPFPVDRGDFFTMTSADVIFSDTLGDGITWSPFGGVANTVDFFAVAVHEIGDVIGLDQPNEPTQIMNAIIQVDELGLGDIQGAQFVYGTDGADVEVEAGFPYRPEESLPSWSLPFFASRPQGFVQGFHHSSDKRINRSRTFTFDRDLILTNSDVRTTHRVVIALCSDLVIDQLVIAFHLDELVNKGIPDFVGL